MLYDRICHHAQNIPKNIAYNYNGIDVNYATFAYAISKTVDFLTEQQIPPGSLVAIRVKGIAKSWVVSIAARSAGLTTLAIRSTADIPQNVSVAAVLHMHDEPLRREARANGGREFQGVSIPRFWKRATRFDVSDIARTQATGGGHILYTSGTTGTGKGVFLSGELEDLRNARRAETLGLSASSIFHGMSFGAWTGAGYKQPAALWHMGGTVIFDQRPEQLLNYAEHGSHQVALLPADILQLMKMSEGEDLRRSDTLVSISSGFTSRRLIEFIRARLSANIILRYSATELIDVPLFRRDDGGDDFYWLDVAPGSVVEIVDGDDAMAAVDEEGILRIRLQPGDPQAYLDEEVASAAVFRHGCFYPGDMAVRRSDGRIRILGRVSDVINVHGHKLAVAPLELAIQAELSAEEVCLFIHINAAGDEEMIVAVQSQVDPTADQVKRITASLPGVDVIRLETMPEFPRSDTGTRKVQRAALKAMLT